MQTTRHTTTPDAPRRTRRRVRTPILIAGVLTSLAAGAATASAGSLVYVKDANVWLAADDGSAQVAVTTDGTPENPYVSPSQSDDGTIVAARRLPNGGPLLRMRQNGQVLGQIPLAPMQFGPFDPAISPDGSTVAYTRGFARYVNGYLETGTDIRYTRVEGYTDPAGVPGVSTGATTPSWIDGGRTLVGRGTVAFVQVPGSAAAQWWSDYDHQAVFGGGADLSDGELAAGTLAMIRANGNGTVTTIQFYSAAGGTAATPTPTCTVSDPAGGPAGAKFADPTLSADGRTAFWQEGDGVYRADLPVDGGCEGWVVRRLIDGATEPDWSPAAAAPGPRTAVSAPGPAAPAPSAPGAGTAPRPAASPRAATTSCARRTGAARERCAYAAAVARCAKLRGSRAKSACTARAKRTRAVAACRRTRAGAAEKSCIRRVTQAARR